MKKERLLSIQTIENTNTYAIYKARRDVNTIMDSCHYLPIVLGSTSPIGFWRVLKRYWDIASLRFLISRRDRAFLQFPWIHNNKPQFYNSLFGSGAHIECIIHDLDSLRGLDENNQAELEALNRCRSIIAHTPAMKRFLADNGIAESKIKLLYLFPYLTSDPIHTLEPAAVNTVIFAGNLTKSSFVDKLRHIAAPDLHFNLYGNGAEHFEPSAHVCYKGTFRPDNPGCIEGNWGLVWDGPDIDTCSGIYGRYLRLNSSHKLSLYLALGIPVIVWSESSLRNFITDNNLGICVSSLADLRCKLGSMGTAEVAGIINSVRRFAPQLRNGDILRNIIG